MADYGGTEDQEKEKEVEAIGAEKEAGELALSKPLMQEEDRNTGQIQWRVYSLYISAAGGLFWAFFIVFTLLVEQGGLGILFNHSY